MFCSKCGAQLPADASFCMKCGAPTGNSAALPRSARIPAAYLTYRAGFVVGQTAEPGSYRRTISTVFAGNTYPDPYANFGTYYKFPDVLTISHVSGAWSLGNLKAGQAGT